MYVISLLLKIAALGTGLKAAWLWWQASKVLIAPGFVLDGKSEPVDTFLRQSDVDEGIMRSTAKAGEMNATAAAWTAIAVALNGVVSFLG